MLSVWEDLNVCDFFDARMLSVWEDLNVCDFLDITDSWKLVGWGKMGFKAQTCWTDLLAFWGVWNWSRILNFGPDRLFFRFSRALICTYAEREVQTNLGICTYAKMEVQAKLSVCIYAKREIQINLGISTYAKMEVQTNLSVCIYA